MDDNGVTVAKKPRKYGEIFEENCPFYLSIGMTYEQYWEGEASLPRYYRKAYKIRQEKINQEAWLNGLYTFDALVSALSHLNPKQSSHKNYVAEPYSFNTVKNDEEKKIEAEAQAEVWMKSWAAATKKMFKEK